MRTITIQKGTSDYSFGYIAEWSKNKDMKELTSSLYIM